MTATKIGIIGASGYTGLELIKLVLSHPHFKLSYVSTSTGGVKLSELHPCLLDVYECDVVKADAKTAASESDLVFLALPHKTAMEYVKELMKTDVKIVDLSADYRLTQERYEENYCPHIDASNLKNSVYGLPELYREEIKKVSGIGQTAFEQAAGFLRISNGSNPLDATSIHPESYDITRKLLEKFSVSDVNQGEYHLKEKITREKISVDKLAEEMACGLPTLIDILNDLEKPGRDPRDQMPKPIFRQDVLQMEDLKEGMILKGTVRNVVDFGAFIDIGVKHDGLVHISNLTTRYTKSPYDILQVGDVVDVKVLSIDIERERIALSMKFNLEKKSVE